MAETEKSDISGICGFATTTDGKGVVAFAEVQLSSESTSRRTKSAREAASEPPQSTRTDAAGRYDFRCEPGSYRVHCEALGQPPVSTDVLVEADETTQAEPLKLPLQLALYTYGDGNQRNQVSRAVAGQPLVIKFEAASYDDVGNIKWTIPLDARTIDSEHEVELVFSEAGKACIEATVVSKRHAPGAPRPEVRMKVEFIVSEPATQTIRGNVGVTLHRSASNPTLDQALWFAIRNRTHAISFDRYREFLNRVLRWEENSGLPEPIERRLRDLGSHLRGVTAYQALKIATEIFLLTRSGVRIGRDDYREIELKWLRRSRAPGCAGSGRRAGRAAQPVSRPSSPASLHLAGGGNGLPGI